MSESSSPCDTADGPVTHLLELLLPHAEHGRGVQRPGAGGAGGSALVTRPRGPRQQQRGGAQRLCAVAQDGSL